MLLFIVPLLAWLYNQVNDAASSVGDFVRSIPSFFAPKPVSASLSTYIPPFVGGQCTTVVYGITFRQTHPDSNYDFGTGEGNSRFVDRGDLNQKYGPVLSFGLIQETTNQGITQKPTVTAGNPPLTTTMNTGGGDISALYTYSQFTLTPRGAGIDNCGNLPDTRPVLPIADDGLFDPQNPLIADENGTINPAAIVLVPAIPLVLIPLISSAIAAALNAAKNAVDALEAVKKIAEALEGLADLWKLLKEFLDDWKRNRPKNRDIVRQTYGQILGDGALDFFPNNNTKFKAIQLDVIITSIPIGFGKFFGSLSPSRYRYKELGYIAFYSVTQGVLEVHSIQFKRTSYQIPELAIGFIYHLGLNNQVRGYAFGTFSVEKT